MTANPNLAPNQKSLGNQGASIDVNAVRSYLRGGVGRRTKNLGKASFGESSHWWRAAPFSARLLFHQSLALSIASLSFFRSESVS